MRARTSGSDDTAGLGSLTQTHTRIHKYSCFRGFFLSNTHAHVYPYGEITHLQYHIANSVHKKDRCNQIPILTHRNTHTQANTHKCVTVQEKALVSQYPRDQTRPGPFSLSVSALSLSISGWWGGFWHGGQRAGSLCQAGKGYKAAALTTREPFFPFQTNSHLATSLPTSGTGVEGESNWPPVRLIRPYWIWLIENTRIKHTRQNRPFMNALESCYLLIVPWVELQMYQIDEEVNVHLERGQ